MARPTDFDLARELAKPSFTPARSDAPALIDLVISDDERVASRATAALAGLGPAARSAIEARLPSLSEAAQAALIPVIGLVARSGDAEAASALISLTRDAHVRVRRAAIVALGKLGSAEAGAALLARWDADDVPPDERRALTEALGKVGGSAALERLRAFDPGGDRELARRRDRAILMADRTAKRDETSTIATDVAPTTPLDVRLGCRPGLAALLHRELATIGTFEPRPAGDAAVDVRLTGSWSTLFRSRLWASAAIRCPLRDASNDPDKLAGAITRALTSPSVSGLMRSWTRGPVRWRLSIADGHRRAVLWQVARDVTAAAPDLINDPTQTTWDVRVDPDAAVFEVVPRRAADPRFAYRVAEIPAASHPTVAATLALVAEARPQDRVWDPFCGSGLELIERARLGPARMLLGTDLDPDALAAARQNLDAAGVTAELHQADARKHDPGPIELIITNPPLGSRVQIDAAALLIDALPGFARRLVAGGRLVWITPAHRRTHAAATRCGLVLAGSWHVDLGGVRGCLERWDKR